MTHYVVKSACVYIGGHWGRPGQMLYQGARIPDWCPPQVLEHFLANNLVEPVGETAYNEAPAEVMTTSGKDSHPANYPVKLLPADELAKEN
jgi:hypothetical protein